MCIRDREYNDMKSFEAAILELVLDKQKEQYTLILNSLKTEIEKSIHSFSPITKSARISQKVQMVKAEEGSPKSSSLETRPCNREWGAVRYRVRIFCRIQLSLA